MKKKYDADYYLGFDIGTSSIGYAVTDENYNVLKFNCKSMWGSRLFDQAQTAEERRIFRTNSRRLGRKKWRIELLQELFADEISKVDMGFYQRLKDSSLHLEDKKNRDVNSLFNDINFTDKEFHERFKTIHHLRKALITENEQFDVRLIYLAIHNILKNRGHFLFSGSIENATSFKTTFENFKNCLSDEFGLEIGCNSESQLEDVLKNKNYTRKDKNKKILSLLECQSDTKQLKAIVALISGLKVKLCDVFNDETLKDIDKNSISFSESSYDENRDSLEEVLQERCITLDIIKSVYDWAILADILAGGEHEDKFYLSISKANIYEEHKQDLSRLKKLIKAYAQEEYKNLFSQVKNNNYCSYVGFTEKNKKKISIKKCTKEEFYKEVTKILKKIELIDPENNDLNIIKEKIATKTFMPLQIVKENGVIPYQVNELELKKILENSEKYLPFLSAQDEKGITVSQKILTLLKFKVPYYVGPLNTFHKENSWMVRKKEGRITPWNFEDKVDIDKSAAVFIRRMTNKCSYLVGKDVVPKNSLIYSEFMVLNEINNIRIEGEKLPVELKKKLFYEVFKYNKRVTGKMLLDFLKSEGISCTSEKLSGFDKNFKTSLKPYIDFRQIFKPEAETLDYNLMIEEIILFISLYGAEPNMLKRVIRNNYNQEEVSDNQLKALVKLKYNGWGVLSKELLTEIEFADTETGECFTVLQALRETDNNFMELLSQRFTLSEEIDKANLQEKNLVEKITYESTVKDLIASPAIKRATWQVILLAEEIKKIMGKEPKKIFIEVAREHEGSKRTKSRKNKLIELYDKCKDEERDWKKELEAKNEDEFRSIKLYLYYTQMGKCMYSGDSICLSELSNTQIYDRDHIYPQSLTKDDSLDNLVLVKKTINAEKNNDVISPEIQEKMSSFWELLRKKGFISEEKYNRLIRKTPLTNEELAGFINRQLVETRQSSKIVANLFKDLYRTSDIVYVKAKSVANFRKDNLNVVKVRTLNDMHHAKGAYLNIVVGNVYHEKFTNNPLKWLKKAAKNNTNKNYSLNRMFNFDLVKGDRIIWKAGNEGTIEKIRKQVHKNDILCTRYAVTNKGSLFDLQLVAASNNATVSVKKGMDTSKYGGYKSISTAYFILVESEDKKGQTVRTIEAVPIYKVKEFEKENSSLVDYCENYLGLKNPRVVLNKIKINSLIVIDGFPMFLKGRSGNGLLAQCAVQLCLPSPELTYLKKIEKYIKRNLDRTDKKSLLSIREVENITAIDNINLYDVLLSKQKNTIYNKRPNTQYEKIEAKRDRFISLSLEEQCIVINEILNLMRCKSVVTNLELLGEGKEVGKIKIKKEISKNNSSKIINESVTGLFRKEIDLLKI